MSEDNKFVYNDDIVDMRRAKELIAGSTAYIAVEKDYGGIEKAVLYPLKTPKTVRLRCLTTASCQPLSEIKGNSR